MNKLKITFSCIIGIIIGVSDYLLDFIITKETDYGIPYIIVFLLLLSAMIVFTMVFKSNNLRQSLLSSLIIISFRIIIILLFSLTGLRNIIKLITKTQNDYFDAPQLLILYILIISLIVGLLNTVFITLSRKNRNITNNKNLFIQGLISISSAFCIIAPLTYNKQSVYSFYLLLALGCIGLLLSYGLILLTKKTVSITKI